MGIADRDYRDRTPSGGLSLRGLSATKWLIIINCVVFFLQALTYKGSVDPFTYYGHFSTKTVFNQLEVYRLVTFQFLHGGITHLFFNMFGLYIFGPIIEDSLGKKKYLALYLVCGIFGGLLYLLLNLLGNLLPMVGIAFPGLLFHDPATPLVGASAGVFGVIMASAYVLPDSKVVLFPIPIELKIKTLAYVYCGLAVASWIIGTTPLGPVLRMQNAGGEAAHVGGAIAGYFFIRNSHLLRDFFDVFEDSRKPNRNPRSPDTSAPRSRGFFSGMFSRDKPLSDAELDRILRKISDSGMSSLSEKERRALQADTDLKRKQSGG